MSTYNYKYKKPTIAIYRFSNEAGWGEKGMLASQPSYCSRVNCTSLRQFMVSILKHLLMMS